MKAIDLISKSIPSLRTSDDGATALRWMNEFHVSHLPIVNDTQLLGLISEEEILTAHGEEEAIGSLPLNLLRPFIHDTEHAFEVLKLAAQLRLTVIPVIDEKENYVGSVTRDNLLNFLAYETDIIEPGGILVLDLNLNDYSLGEISRVIESAGAKILSAFTKTMADANKIELTLKINQTQLQHVVTALGRYNYIVKESFVEPEYFENLQERYDALMNYLNI
jgi:acetoin utilization protein AcuB